MQRPQSNTLNTTTWKLFKKQQTNKQTDNKTNQTKTFKWEQNNITWIFYSHFQTPRNSSELRSRSLKMWWHRKCWLYYWNITEKMNRTKQHQTKCLVKYHGFCFYSNEEKTSGRLFFHQPTASWMVLQKRWLSNF